VNFGARKLNFQVGTKKIVITDKMIKVALILSTGKLYTDETKASSPNGNNAIEKILMFLSLFSTNVLGIRRLKTF